LQLFQLASNNIPTFSATTLTAYLSPTIPRYAHILGVVRQMQRLLPCPTVVETFSQLGHRLEINSGRRSENTNLLCSEMTN
jgi:hypothetical protein